MVPDTIAFAVAFKVAPAAIVKVPVPEVIVLPLIVLFVKASFPAKVTGKAIGVAVDDVTSPFPFTVIVGTDVPVP